MSEQVATQTENVEQQSQQQSSEQQNVVANPFDESSWNTNEVIPEKNEESHSQEQSEKENSGDSTIETQTQEEEEVVDLDEYVKKSLGFENFDSLKSEIEELRKLKENANTKEEQEFAN